MQGTHLIRLLTAAILYAASVGAYAADPTHAALRAEFLEMQASDQEVRQGAAKGDFSRWAAVDDANRARLKQIVAAYGWPNVAMVGRDGASAAWLLAQHADRDKPFQHEVLALMEPLVQQGQASGKNFAYLVDRTHYPQRFGTQGSCVSRAEWQPFEIEDIARVDERRSALALPPLAEYEKLFKEACASPHMSLHSASHPKRTVAIPQ